MFAQLEKINHRPKAYEFYTAQDLWDDEYVSQKMLELHLNPEVDLASRKRAFIGTSSQWIASRFQLGSGKRVCDFGCGPGLYAERFAKTGAKVTGLDFSRNSIAHARKQALKQGLAIDYCLGNYLEFRSEKKFDLITMIYLDFCPLSPAQRQQLLQIFAAHLKSGGRVFMDVLTSGYFEQAREEMSCEYSPEGGFWAPGPYYAFMNTWKYPDTSLVLGQHTIIEEARKRKIFNWLQCFSQESLALELDRAGFRIIEQYSNVAGQRFQENGTEMAVVLEKA